MKMRVRGFPLETLYGKGSFASEDFRKESLEKGVRNFTYKVSSQFTFRIIDFRMKE
jgi:hypothetical protein